MIAHRPRRARGIALVAVLSSTAACVKQLPPPPAPEPVAPRVDASAPVPEGRGRLVIDVSDGPTPVHQVVLEATPTADGQGGTSYRFDGAARPLCTTPCVADLPLGNVLLEFPVNGDAGRVESEVVHVGAAPTVYRRTLSWYEERGGALQTWGIVGTSVGAAAAITGAVLLPVGLEQDSDGLANAGLITLGAGAALVAFGVWALRREADLYRPGSANHFPFGP